MNPHHSTVEYEVRALTPMHLRGTTKAPTSPKPQGRLEQIGRGTRAEWREEGAEGELKNRGGWSSLVSHRKGF
ncbi:MAG: hypothetical protein HF976_09520 [ANME-2 cluster archaeon]|nr:hypothetical protein [ANME-2 cluster archaeon]MBC2701633.1 hypothetical protein [ANME-2 cluster archaeon]MBC2708819.1 hypothetical protein [ANME-2 cluster archaeon]MBC2746489.1 hypothetical protein [ANME-2 cluster archaeon]